MSDTDMLLGVFEGQKTSGKEQAVLIKADGTLKPVDGPWEASKVIEKLRELIVCQWVQMIPCHDGKLAGYEIWCNEEGMYQDELNDSAMAMLSTQVADGKLHGNVLVVRSGFIA